MKQKKIRNVEKKNILILGGGFAGVRAALDLNHLLSANDEYQIVVIDKKDYHLYTPALYEAATTEHGLVEAKRVKKALAFPLAKIFSKTRVKVFKAFIENVDFENGLVVTDSKILNYNYLIVGLGSISDFYGITSIEKHGYALKTLDDAIMIRNRVEELVTKKESARIVIGGAGYTGAEFAGELHNLIKHECQHHNRKLENYEIMMVEGATGFLPGLPENISKIVGQRLLAMGIKAKFSTLVTEAGPNFVMLNNKEKLDCDLLIWTGGVRACRTPFSIQLERDKKDRMVVTDYLNIKKYPNVFIAGDVACYIDNISKKAVPQTAPEAIGQAKIVAKNVFRMINRKQLALYTAGSTKYVIPVAGKFAIFYTKTMFMSGISGWLLRKAIDLKYLLSILPFWTSIGYWLFETELFIKND